jgi:hypothetical protein
LFVIALPMLLFIGSMLLEMDAILLVGEVAALLSERIVLHRFVASKFGIQ